MLYHTAKIVWHCGAKKLGAKLMIRHLDNEFAKYLRTR